MHITYQKQLIHNIFTLFIFSKTLVVLHFAGQNVALIELWDGPISRLGTHVANALFKNVKLLVYVQFCVLVTPANTFENVYLPLYSAVPSTTKLQQSKV